MLVTALYRADREPAVSGAPAFTDTQADTWYSDAAAWASENGLAQGYGNSLTCLVYLLHLNRIDSRAL